MVDEATGCRLTSMRLLVAENEYYAVTLTATEEGRIESAVQSHWVGYVDDGLRVERRTASLVDPGYMVRAWTELQQPYIVANCADDLLWFLLTGGNCLVEKSVAEAGLARLLETDAFAHFGEHGFKRVSDLPVALLQRRPKPKHRMRILERDDYRCKLCGQRPANDENVVLHVHHIRPWESGGITEDENLITLCHTCHDGLFPHHKPDLHALLRQEATNVVEVARSKLLEGMARYRDIIAGLSVELFRPA